MKSRDELHAENIELRGEIATLKRQRETQNARIAELSEQLRQMQMDEAVKIKNSLAFDKQSGMNNKFNANLL